MNFCFVTTFFPPYHYGGDGVFTASLANLLVANGHQVTVVHCRNSYLGKPNPFPVDPRIQVHSFYTLFGILSPLGTYLTGTPFLKDLEEILDQKFDVIHWHNASLMGAPDAFALGPARARRLMTLHEYWLICPTHILFRDRKIACTDRACYSCTLRHHRPPQIWRQGGVIRHGLDPIHTFIAPSEFVAAKHREFLPDLPLKVLPHFAAARHRSEAPKEDFFLFVGRLETAKGLQTILPTFAKNGLRLKVAGTGSDEAALRQQASPNVEFLGRVAPEKLPALYAAARATLVPSICYETFGLVILESLQQGTPVITSHYGALPEIVAATGGGTVYHNEAEFEAALQSAAPVDADLSAFSPQRHLAAYLAIAAPQ